MTIVDCVTSLGAHPVDAGAWGADAVYSCTQKGLGAPSGLAPITFSKRAIEFAEGKAAESTEHANRRGFFSALRLLRAYGIDRKYPHTIPAPKSCGDTCDRSS